MRDDRFDHIISKVEALSCEIESGKKAANEIYKLRNEIILLTQKVTKEYFRVSIGEIVSELAEKHNTSVIALKQKCRKHDILEIRNSIMWVLRNEHKFTLAPIAKFFNLTHSTVLNSLNNVAIMPKVYSKYLEK